jgi:hypothetical protein
VRLHGAMRAWAPDPFGTDTTFTQEYLRRHLHELVDIHSAQHALEVVDQALALAVPDMERRAIAKAADKGQRSPAGFFAYFDKVVASKLDEVEKAAGERRECAQRSEIRVAKEQRIADKGVQAYSDACEKGQAARDKINAGRAPRTNTKSAPNTQKTPFPEGAVLSEEGLVFALEGLTEDEAHREWDKMSDWMRQKGAPAMDWSAAYRNWVRREVDDRRKRASRGGPPRRSGNAGASMTPSPTSPGSGATDMMTNIVRHQCDSLPNTTTKPGMPVGNEVRLHITSNLLYPIFQTFAGGQAMNKSEVEGLVKIYVNVLTGFEPEAYAIAAAMMLEKRKNSFRPVPAEIRECLAEAELRHYKEGGQVQKRAALRTRLQDLLHYGGDGWNRAACGPRRASPAGGWTRARSRKSSESISRTSIVRPATGRTTRSRTARRMRAPISTTVAASVCGTCSASTWWPHATYRAILVDLRIPHTAEAMAAADAEIAAHQAKARGGGQGARSAPSSPCCWQPPSS